ncbi:MAG: DUF4384 domain-containing protein [Gemmatimonadales bacterium]
MIVPLVSLLLQTTPPPTPAPLDVAGREDKLVHVWLDPPSPLARGAAVRVYVQVVADGNLIVLQRRSDGHISVLFPGSPAAAPFVRAGTYEIREAGDRPAFVVGEPDGRGMILAALATDPMRFNEFVRQADWSSDALVPSWGGGGGGADAEGALTDIVQRMLGAGTFNYDFATYTVAPAGYAQQQAIPGYAPYAMCGGCTFIGTEVVIAVPFLGCDAFFGVCFGFPRFQRGLERRPPVEDRPARVLALDLRPRRGPVAVARRGQLLIPQRDRSTTVVKPRRRLPDAASRGAPSMPLAAAGASTAAPLRHVRYTRLSNPSNGDHVARGGGVAVSRSAVVPAGGASLPAVARSGTSTRVGVLVAPRPNVARTASDAGAVRAPRATSGGTRSIALPGARGHVAGRRGGVARASVARH